MVEARVQILKEGKRTLRHFPGILAWSLSISQRTCLLLEGPRRMIFGEVRAIAYTYQGCLIYVGLEDLAFISYSFPSDLPTLKPFICHSASLNLDLLLE